MKTFTPVRLLGALLLLALAFPAFAQSPVGVWRTIDDESGEPKSHVEIFEQDGKLHGRIVMLLPEGRTCTPCADGFEGRDLRGVVILRDMEQDGDEWNGGSITDPKSGRNYRAKMSLDGATRLRVRGFVGFSMLGRTQVWERVQ